MLRQLVAFAESEARRRGYDEIRLYTHVVMADNVAYYERLGWEETHRGEQAGYQRIFMRKSPLTMRASCPPLKKGGSGGF